MHVNNERVNRKIQSNVPTLVHKYGVTIRKTQAQTGPLPTQDHHSSVRQPESPQGGKHKLDLWRMLDLAIIGTIMAPFWHH